MTTMKRRLGLLPLLAVSVGGIIGSAWLFAPLYAAQVAGPGAIFSWLISGGAALILAMVYAELGAAFPVAGGLARFSYFSHGNLAGFVAGFACWLGYVAIAPIEVQAMIRYMADTLPWLLQSANAPELSWAGIGCAAALLFLMSLINLLGVQWFAESNKILTIWKIFVPVSIPLALMWVGLNRENFSAHGGFLPSGWNGVFAGVSTGGTLFAMLGFRAAIEMAGEAKNPGRDMPIAIIGSVLITSAIYLLIQIGFIGALSEESLSHGWSKVTSHVASGPFVELAAAAGLVWLVRLIYIDSLVSPGGCGLVFCSASARLSYALSLNGQFPKFFRRLNGNGVPAAAVTVNFLVGLMFFAPSQTWQTIVSFISSIQIFSLAFGAPALLALRRTAPDVARSFRLPFAGPVCAVAFIAANIIIYWCGWETNRVTLGLVAAAAAAFIAIKRIKSPHEPLDLQGLHWLVPYFAGLAAISAAGGFGGGYRLIPEGWNALIIAVFSLVILRVSLIDPRSKVPSQSELQVVPK